MEKPIRKVKAPILAVEPIEPVSIEDVVKLIEKCDCDFTGTRDKAMILGLLELERRNF